MRTFLIIAATAAAVNAMPTPECCKLVAELYPKSVFYEHDPNYEFETSQYWSSTCTLKPACFFTPSNTNEVSAAVKLFSRNSCRFSVRGAGHSSIPGAANNDGGVTIAMSNFLQRKVDPVNNIMSIGPGNRFYQVYNEADKYSKVPVIGRYGQVGTGLLLGAGLSFLNNAHGLGIDNVAGYEVVVSDGRLVYATRNANSDLFHALKGGGDNFGVITRYDVMLYDRPKTVTGGLITYGEAAMSSIDILTYQYHTQTAVNDHKTHVLPQWGYNGATKQREAFVPFYYAEDVGVPGKLPKSLEDWTLVPYTSNTVRSVTRIEDLAAENNLGYNNGAAQEQRTFTIYADLNFFTEVSRLYYEWSKKYDTLPGFYTLNCKMPITPYMVQQGIQKGRNSLGLEDVQRPLSVLYFGLTLTNKSDTERVFPEHAAFVESLRKLAKERGVLYKYIMWNYSAFDQAVISSYGKASVDFLTNVSHKYDPTGAFQKLVGGQKIPTG